MKMTTHFPPLVVTAMLTNLQYSSHTSTMRAVLWKRKGGMSSQGVFVKNQVIHTVFVLDSMAVTDIAVLKYFWKPFKRFISLALRGSVEICAGWRRLEDWR